VGAIEDLGASEARRAKQDSSGDHVLSANVVSGGGEQGVEGAASIAKGCGAAAARSSPDCEADADAGSAGAEAKPGYAARYQTGCGKTARFAGIPLRAADDAVFSHSGLTPQLAG
jgi:hypothetical protein